MNSRKYLGFLIIGAILISSTTTYILRASMVSSMETVETVLLIEIFISTLNIVLLSALTVNYVKVNRELATPLSRSLLIFSSALTLYALSSSPVTHYLLGIGPISIGPLTYIPELFVAAASLTLLYQNYK